MMISTACRHALEQLAPLPRGSYVSFNGARNNNARSTYTSRCAGRYLSNEVGE